MDPSKKQTIERDESGNVKLGDIGIFFRDKITEYCKTQVSKHINFIKIKRGLVLL